MAPLRPTFGLRRNLSCLRVRASVFILFLAVPWADHGIVYAQDPVSGSHVFGTRGCATCHAVGGIGGKIGPDLKDISHARSFYDLTAAMWNHLPNMADQLRKLRIPRPRLDAREANDLIAFLATLNYFDPRGNSQAGEKLFFAKRCVVCHQVGGIGGVIGPNLNRLILSASAISIAASMWNHGPAMTEMMRAKGIERPSFTGNELRDLISYLKANGREAIEEPIYAVPGRVEEGRRLFSRKRCSECHGGKGEGGGLGPALSNRRVPQGLFPFAAAMWNKAPIMTKLMKDRGLALPQLDAGEMASIVAYLYSVNYFAESGNATRGRELLAAKGCSTCHSTAGETARGGGSLIRLRGIDQPAAFVSALWNHLALLEKGEEQSKTQWPQLTSQQMADIIALLQTLGQERR